MAARKKRAEEYQEKIRQAIEILNRVSEDTTTPRNIRRAAKQAADILQKRDLTPAVSAANAVSILDEISQDPNMPPYTRTTIWQVVTLLEAIRD